MSGIPIEDNNKERKNLTLLSFAMIVFYLGGGEMVDSTLRLPLINLQFHCAPALGFLAWGVLVWFTFRYWVESKDATKEAFLSELDKTEYLQKLTANHISKKVSGNGRVAVGKTIYEFKSLNKGGPKEFIVTYTRAGIVNGGGIGHFVEIYKVERGLGWYIWLRLALRVMWEKPSVTANYSPYAMVLLVFCCWLTKDLPFYPARLFS